MRDQLLKIRGSWKSLLAGILLISASFLFLGVPTGDYSNPSPLSFLFYAIVLLGGIYSISRTKWNFAKAASIFGVCLPLIAFLLVYVGVFFSFWQGLLVVGGFGGVFSLIAFILVSITKHQFFSRGEESVQSEIITIAWLIIVSGCIGLVDLIMTVLERSEFRNEFIQLLSFSVISIVAAVGILKRHNWGRILYVLSFIIEIGWTFYSFNRADEPRDLMELLIYLIPPTIFKIIAIYFLLRPVSSSYFRHEMSGNLQGKDTSVVTKQA